MSNVNCILSNYCETFKSGNCSPCPAYIQIHGMSGKGGRLAAMRVPLEYRYVVLDNSPVISSQPKIYEVVDKYVKSFVKLFDQDNPLDTKKRIRSLYLWGEGTGTGKTTTACAILNEFLTTYFLGCLKHGITPVQIPAYFLDVNEFQELYNKFNRPNVSREVAETSSIEYYNRMELAKKSPLCVFDDLGVRNATESFRADLHSIINGRVTAQLPSIYTSNLPMESLEEVYDNRLYDRVKDLTVPLEFIGNSNRGIR